MRQPWPHLALALAVLLVPAYAFSAAQAGPRGVSAQLVGGGDAYLEAVSLGPSETLAARLSPLNGFTAGAALAAHGYEGSTVLQVTASIVEDAAQRFALVSTAATLGPGQAHVFQVEDVPLVDGPAPDGDDGHGHHNSQGGGHAYAYGHCKPGHDNHLETCADVLGCRLHTLKVRLDALVLGPAGERRGEFVVAVPVHLWAGSLC